MSGPISKRASNAQTNDLPVRVQTINRLIHAAQEGRATAPMNADSDAILESDKVFRNERLSEELHSAGTSSSKGAKWLDETAAQRSIDSNTPQGRTSQSTAVPRYP